MSTNQTMRRGILWLSTGVLAGGIVTVVATSAVEVLQRLMDEQRALQEGQQALREPVDAAPMRVETGTVYHEVLSPVPGQGDSGRVDFVTPFSFPPDVHVGLVALDFVQHRAVRVNLVVLDVDTPGFTWELRSWAQTLMHKADFKWIAVGR